MAETPSTPSLRGAPDQFIVLCGQIVGNGTDGFQTVYGWDGVIHEERKAAIAAGWKERDSDDFNIGVIRNGRLASLDWMDESLGETAETLIEIEEQIDWRDPRDTFEVGQEADSLQQGGGESDFAWIARLRAHFIDPTTLTEAVAAARAEGVREGLERASRICSDDVAELQCSVSVATAERIKEAVEASMTAPPTTPGGRTDG